MMMMMMNFTNNTRNTRIDALTPTPAVNNDNRFRIGDNKIQTPNSLNLKNTNEPNNQAADNFLDLDTYGSSTTPGPSRVAKVGANITGYSNTTTLFSPSSGYSMNPKKESLFEDGNFVTNIISHYSPGLNNDNKNNDYSNHYQATTKLPSFSTDLINIDLEEEEEEERGGGETHSTGIIPAQKIPPIISLGSESLFGQATAAAPGSTITSNPPPSSIPPNPLYLPVQTQIYSQLQNEGIGKNHNYPPSSSTPSNNSLKKPKTGFSSVYSSPTPYLNHENLHQSYFLGLTDPYATATTGDNIAITQISSKTTTVNPIVSSTNNSYHKKYGKDSSTKSPGVKSMKNKVNFNNPNNSDSSSCDGYHCSDSSCCCSSISTDSSSPSSPDNDISLSNRKKRRRKRISYRVDGEEAVSSSSCPPLMLSPRKSQLQESENNNNNNSNNRRVEGDTGDCVGGRAATLGALLLEPLGVKNKAGAVAERSAGGTGDDDDDFDGKKKASALWANSNPTTTDVVIKENGSAVAATTNSSYSISTNRSSNTILGVPSSSVCAGFISSSGSCRRKTEDRERKEEELEEEREEEEENVVGYYHKHCHYSSSSSCVQKKKQSSSCRECRRLFEVNNNNRNNRNNNNNDVPKFAASSDDNDVGAEEDNGGTGGGAAGGEDEGLNRESKRRRIRKGKEEEEEEDEEEEDYSEKQQLLESSSSTYKYRTSGGGVGSNISSSNSSRGPQKKPDNRWWWGSRKNKNNRRWWYPVVGRKGLFLPRTRKKRALQDLHNLELSEDFSLEDDEGGGVTTTPYTTTGSVSFVVDDDDDDGGVGPSRPLLLHCNKPYHKQVTPGEQQEHQPEDCHRYHHHEHHHHHRQHYHHHHHRRHRLQKQQSSPYHYCRRSSRGHHHCPQVGEKEDPKVDRQHYHRHHHHRHQQQKQIHHHHHHEGDGDGEPLYLQEQQQDPFYRHENNCKEGHCYCYYSCRRVRGSASATSITRTTTTLTADNNYSPSPTYHGCHHDDDDDQEEGEEEEEEKEEKEVKKLGGIIRGGGRVGRWNRNRFRRGQEEATSTTMDSCTQCLKNEFKPENAGLHHEDPSVFVRSQWPLDHRLYVFYRIVVALGFIAWILADIIDETEKFYKDRFWIWFIFATNWSFILLTMTTIFEAICSSYYLLVARGFIDKFRYHKENADQQYFQEMPICLKIQWLLYNLGANTAIVITISYWSFIFFMEHSKFLMTNMSKMKHMLNTVYVVLDIFISATPIRIFHMLFPIMLGSIYAIFNASYFLNDGTILDGRHYAYNVLNWNVPAEAIVTCILCIAQTIFSQIILYHLAALRKWIASKIYKPHEPIPEHDSEMLSIMSADSTTYLATDSQNEGGAPGNFH